MCLSDSCSREEEEEEEPFGEFRLPRYIIVPLSCESVVINLSLFGIIFDVKTYFYIVGHIGNVYFSLGTQQHPKQQLFAEPTVQTD